MHRDGVDFHDVAELRAVEDFDGEVIQRIPEDVRVELNEGARDNYRRPAGSEIRFVPDGTARVTLSSPDGEAEVLPFWGPFQGEAAVVGPEPRTIEVEAPERLADLRPEVAEGYDYHPRLCRLLLPHRSGPLCYHGVEGDVRPPTAEEVPDRRYLAYGTSITRGFSATGPHLTYVNRVARELGVDPLNLGTAGSAYCEAAIADHVADRDDWDLATLAISVNMVAGFSVEEFRERAGYVIETAAERNPDRPVACITLFPYFPDLCADPDGHENHERFREVVRELVADSSRDNVSLIEGPEALPAGSGLTTDLVHPGDDAMIAMGRHVAAELADLLAE